MENFKSFFKNSTPHTREHQQVAMRGINRKHLNQVPRSKGQQALDPMIDSIIKNNRVGRWPVSNATATRLIKTYPNTLGKHNPETSYSKSVVSQSNINLVYNAQTKKFYLERQNKN